MAGVNIATAYVDIIPAIKGIRKETRRMLGDFGDAGRKSGSFFGNAFAGGIGGLVALGAAKAAQSVKNTIVSTVQSFSNLEDATGAASVIFGDSMKKIIDSSMNANRAMGLSKAQVIDASNMFGTFGKAAGLSGDSLANFSVDLTKLAGDLSSFKGGTVEDAITAIGAAMRGENEPIRKYGVLLDDFTVKQQAMKMGLIKTTKEALTPQNKTLAVTALLFEQTKDAQGDFARTFTSTQNTLKTYTASLVNLKSSIGSAFAPVVAMMARIGTEIFESLSNKLDAFKAKYENTFNRWRAMLEIFLAGKIDNKIFEALDIDPKSINSEKIVRLRVAFNENIRKIKEIIDSVFKPIFKGIKDAFVFPTPNVGALTPFMAILKAIGENAPQVGKALGELSNAIVKALIEIAPHIAKVIPLIADAFVKLIPVIVPIIPILADLAVKFIELITPILQNETLMKTLLLSFAGFKIGKVVASVARLGKNFITTAKNIRNFVTAGERVSKFKSIIDTVRLRFMYLGDRVRKIASLLRGGLVSAFNRARNVIKIFGSGLRVAANVVKNVALRAVRLFTTGLRVLFTVMRANPIGAIITVIALLVAGIIYLWNNCETFRNIVYAVWGMLKAWASWIVSVLVTAWDSISTAVTNAVNTAWNTITGWIGNITSFFSGLGSTLYDSGASIINGFWNGMKSVWNKLTSWVKTGLDFVRSFFPFSPAKRGPFSGKGWVYYSGKSIGTGLAQGLKDSQPEAVKASSDLTKVMRNVYDTQNSIRLGFSSTIPRTANNNSKNHIVVNIDSTTVSTAEEIAREVSWKLSKI